MPNPRSFPRILRGRLFTAADLEVIAQVLAQRPQPCRRAISLEVCQRLGWTQPNGRPKDRACRVVLLALHREGIIELPPPRRQWQRRQQPLVPRTPQAEPRPPQLATLTDLQPLVLRLVSSGTAGPTADEHLWNELVDRYHFLRYRPIVGPQLKLLIESGLGLVGCIGFGAAAWKVKPRDEWIGWTDSERRRNLHRILNNGRFLLLPWWVNVKCLASHVLGLAARTVPNLWQHRYGWRPLLLETFVHAERHAGTCYRAANWLAVGQTAGRGKWDVTKQFALPIKTVLLCPLTRHPRAALRAI